MFKDTHTPSPFLEHLNVQNDDGTAAKYGKPDHVYLDAMGFGMGSNCLQVRLIFNGWSVNCFSPLHFYLYYYLFVFFFGFVEGDVSGL